MMLSLLLLLLPGLSLELQRKADEVLSPTQLFRAARCTDAITRLREQYSGLWQKQTEGNQGIMEQKQFVMYNEDINLMYVHNQKVGTDSMWYAFHAFGGTFKQHSVPRSGAQLDDAVMRTWTAQPWAQEVPNNKLIFTVVREPLDCAWLAYTEVSHRGLELSTSCNSGDDRYLEYLNLLKEGKIRHTDTYHSYPQVAKVDVLNALNRDSFDFIVRLEKFEEDMRVLFAQLDNPPNETSVQRFFEIFDSWDKEHPHHHDSDCDKAVEETSSEHGLSPTTCKVACDLYDIDYACFGYERPSCCSS